MSTEHITQFVRGWAQGDNVKLLAKRGNAMLSSIDRDEGFLGRYLVAPPYTITRKCDYEVARFGVDSDAEQIAAALQAAVVTLGARMEASLRAPTQAHLINGDASPALESISAWMPWTLPESDNWYGVDRRVDPPARRGLQLDARKMGRGEAMAEAAHLFRRHGGPRLDDVQWVDIGTDTILLAPGCFSLVSAGHSPMCLDYDGICVLQSKENPSQLEVRFGYYANTLLRDAMRCMRIRWSD